MIAVRRLVMSGAACAAGVFVVVALAPLASAEPPSGSYEVTDPTGGLPSLRPWVLTPCGASCVHVQTAGTQNYDLHDQGNGQWTGSHSFKDQTCQDSLDIATMVITSVCTGDAPSLSLLRKIG